MQTMRESWTDERLDDLNAKVDRGFARTDEEIKTLRRETKAGFDTVNGRIDSLQQALVQGVIALTIAILAGFAAITTLLATQL
jgi:hypothetical protein